MVKVEYNTSYYPIYIDSNSNRVASWKGNGNKTTEPFTITKKPWAVIWKVEGNDVGLGMVSIIVFNDKNESISLVANTYQPGSDISYVYYTGTFYLEISSLASNWEVEVREMK